MAKKLKRHVQQELVFKTHGGSRKGAGRKPKTWRSSERHETRPDLDPGSILLLTIRSVAEVGNLRRSVGYHAVRRALYAVIEREHFRICHVSIQTNHIHLIVEADSKDDLSDGMQAFEISVAKHLNAAIVVGGEPRRGSVFEDRYHERLLQSPRQVRNAIAYVLNNWRRHRADVRTPNRKIDPYSSGVSFEGWLELEGKLSIETFYVNRTPLGYMPLSVSLPRTWMLRVGWRKAGPISVHDVPGPKEKHELFGRKKRPQKLRT